VWLVQMGRAAEDGVFARFVERVLGQPLTLTESTLAWTTLRGQSIRFDGAVPLAAAWQVDGVAQPLTNFPHVAGIYGGADALPAAHVDIQYLDHVMRLEFATPEVPNPSSPHFT
jgi:hypothetical protein